MSDVRKIAKNSNFTRDPKTGQCRFAKGTQIGRMPKKGFTLTDLNKMIAEFEMTGDKQILIKHYIEQLFKDNNLLARYMDKNIPTKTISELTGVDGSPLTFVIEKTYKQEESKGKQTESKE